MTLTSYTLNCHDTAGVAVISNVPRSRALVWQEEQDFPGAVTFEVPLTDASTAHLQDRRIVKITEAGSVVFGCRIKGEGTSLAVDGRRWVRFENQPGLLSLLDDAVVEPENGIHRTSSEDRLFGPMSAEWDWYNASDWSAPEGVDYTADVSVNLKRKHQDPSLATYFPQWIAPAPGPMTAVPGGTIACFRASVSIADADAGNFAVMYAGDDYTSIYLDNEPIASSDRSQFYAWRTAQTETVSLTAGDHLFAASVENRPSDSSGNVISFVFVLIKLDDNGDPTGFPFLVSNTTDWLCTTAAVGWRRAEVLTKAFQEAQARATAFPNGVSALTLGFTTTHDSSGAAWDESRGQYSLPITTATLTDVVATLTENPGFNVSVDPATMTLNAYKRAGADKRASVQFRLGDDPAGGSLKALDAGKDVARHTLAYVHLADETWVVAQDGPGVTAAGRIEVGLSLGTASTAGTAHDLAAAQLATSAHPIVSHTADVSSLTGPQWRIAWVKGDTVTIPNERNTGTVPARILAVTHYRDADTARDVPQFTKDGS